MNKPYRVLSTFTAPVTSVPVELRTDEPGYIRLVSNRAFHYAINGDATTDDVPVPADHIEYITQLGDDETLTAVLADGETDGTIWASYIQFA